MFNWLTADGAFAGADGNLDWVVPDEEQARTAAAGIAAHDTVLFGRRTYEMFLGFWPRVVDESPTAPDPHGPRRSTELRAMGMWLTEATKLVFSRTLKEAPWKNSRIVPQLDPAAIAAMKQQPGKDMIIFGSGSLVSQLTQAGLIDEYRFIVTPVLLGDGRRLFTETRAGLELVESKATVAGNVMLRYARRP